MVGFGEHVCETTPGTPAKPELSPELKAYRAEELAEKEKQDKADDERSYTGERFPEDEEDQETFEVEDVDETMAASR